MPESQVYAQIRNNQLNLLGKGATLVPSTVKLLHRKKERKINGNQEGCRLA